MTSSQTTNRIFRPEPRLTIKALDACLVISDDLLRVLCQPFSKFAPFKRQLDALASGFTPPEE